MSPRIVIFFVMLVIKSKVASWVCSETLFLLASCKIPQPHQVVLSCAHVPIEHSCQIRGSARRNAQFLTTVQSQKSFQDKNGLLASSEIYGNVFRKLFHHVTMLEETSSGSARNVCLIRTMTISTQLIWLTVFFTMFQTAHFPSRSFTCLRTARRFFV